MYFTPDWKHILKKVRKVCCCFFFKQRANKHEWHNPGIFIQFPFTCENAVIFSPVPISRLTVLLRYSLLR